VKRSEAEDLGVDTRSRRVVIYGEALQYSAVTLHVAAGMPEIEVCIWWRFGR